MSLADLRTETAASVRNAGPILQLLVPAMREGRAPRNEP
jgi:hypothetical protein